jgi:hypothetical protein
VVRFDFAIGTLSGSYSTGDVRVVNDWGNPTSDGLVFLVDPLGDQVCKAFAALGLLRRR